MAQRPLVLNLETPLDTGVRRQNVGTDGNVKSALIEKTFQQFPDARQGPAPLNLKTEKPLATDVRSKH
ncbi:hypothetical protein [Ferrimonas aestuarii]|uniref:Uncharacterized protein n=1 Tax=Ferrimonas aestuarii TaxID=2569539 RepID=A0A4U1BMD4_9GAMM|nr:hypothetical protein [Ferrimonas aestuarii]TKB52014.1 hypothetical protein FCL42_16485 [Ferrimonas aestuarii]